MIWWERWLADRLCRARAQDKNNLDDWDDDEYETRSDSEKYPASWTPEQIEKAKEIELWQAGAKSSL